MHKRRSALTHRKQRSVLTDMLPFEVPPTFSNRGFYRFLRDNGIEIDGKSLSWNCDTAALDPIVALVFGIKALSKITHETLTQWGKTRTRRSIPLNGCRLDTIPFNFSVAHNLDGRTLSVIHPRNQVEVAGFYGDLLNYTFAIIENKIGKLLKSYVESKRSNRDRKRLLSALLALMEFSFFAYSASPKVNHTIRICRMISTSVEFLNANAIPLELKHLLFKYVHDNIIQQLEKNTVSVHREVESHYLLICLSQIGRDYWLPASTLAGHFLIKENDSTKEYERQGFMNHFSITVLLSYIKMKVRYAKLRAFIEAHAVEKLSYLKAQAANDAESLMLFLDLVICPYVGDPTKSALGAIFDLDAAGLAAVQNVNDHWFTAWGDKFDLGKELDAKRSREVY